MRQLPSRIDPDPIIEAILEIRFVPRVPADAIFGLLYDKFQGSFPRFEQLPILQLPSSIRETDANLTYKAHYKAQQDNFVLQIGPRVITFSCVAPYPGWSIFFERIKETYHRLEQANVIDHIQRIGLRYINIMEDTNVFDVSTMQLLLEHERILKKTSITTELAEEKGGCILNMVSDAEISIGHSGRKANGSVIDIDAFVHHSQFPDVPSAIDHAHDLEKALFFRTLSDDYLKTLEPEYQDND